jgi:hypothetical protein
VQVQICTGGSAEVQQEVSGFISRKEEQEWEWEQEQEQVWERCWCWCSGAGAERWCRAGAKVLRCRMVSRGAEVLRC